MSAGHNDHGTIRLLEATGPTNNKDVRVRFEGAPGSYRSVFVDVDNYSSWDIVVSHGMQETPSTDPGVAQIWIAENPQGAQIASFDETDVVTRDGDMLVNGKLDVNGVTYLRGDTYIGGGNNSSNNIVGYYWNRPLAFWTISSTDGKSTVFNERMRITNDGRVGIGTTTPNGVLDISGNIYQAVDGGTSGGWKDPRCSWDQSNEAKDTPPINSSGMQEGYECYEWQKKQDNFLGVLVVLPISQLYKSKTVKNLLNVTTNGVGIGFDNTSGTKLAVAGHTYLDNKIGEYALTLKSGPTMTHFYNYGSDTNHAFAIQARSGFTSESPWWGRASSNLLLQPYGGKVGIGTERKTLCPSCALDVMGGDINVSFLGSDKFADLPKKHKVALNTDRVGLDIAELFESEEEVEVGDIVAVGEKSRTIRKSSEHYQGTIVGVVSGAPALLFEGSELKLGANPERFIKGTKPPVALAGRITVKVSLENGPIEIGDYLTSSNKPGVAMKATEPGMTVGIALEGYDGKSEDKILVFLSIGEKNTGSVIRELQKRDLETHSLLKSLERRIRMLETKPRW